MKNLTEKQQKFIDVLFEEAQGNPVEAKRLAGYADSVSSTSITGVLQDEIYEATKRYIASSGTRVAYGMMEVFNDPTQLGNKEKIAVAKDFLDRAGFVKTDKIEVKAESPLFILPAKNEN
jgi:hypothetical protein|tara:strand:- start:2189 stop:2548 length:360 start_codon:yes stop_codon:yes gene_type:complete